DDRLAGTIALADRLEHGALRPDLPVAVHAGLRGRQAGKRRRLDRSVAVTAVDARAAHVMAVAEGHGRIPGDADAPDAGGANPAAPGPAGAGKQEQGAEDRDLRDCVETAMEDLRHRDPAGKGSGAPPRRYTTALAPQVRIWTPTRGQMSYQRHRRGQRPACR